jgi:SAM-dependent methyltransferase
LLVGILCFTIFLKVVRPSAPLILKQNPTNQMHDSSFERCREFVENHLGLEAQLSIADVGSYDVNGTYRPLFDGKGWTYIGFDVAAGPNVDVVLHSPEDWQLSSEHRGAFDVVISGQTLEHVRRPWLWIKQVAELCKPGGLIWICAPNTWSFHEHPIDCWRIWPEGMRALFTEANLLEIEARFFGPDTVGIARCPE